MRGMFRYCNRLKTLDMSELNLRSLVDMGNMMQFCGNLESVNMRGLDMSKVTDMSYMFDYCTKLESVNFNNIQTNDVIDMSFMFEGCESLKVADMRFFSTPSLVSTRMMFAGCSALKNAIFGHYFRTNTVTDMGAMFKDCAALEILHLDNFKTANVSDFGSPITGGMFENCSALRLLDIRNFTFSSAEYIYRMFAGCKSLVSIYCYYDLTLAASLINHDEIFLGCDNLKGSEGTVFDPAKNTDKTYARVDGGSGDEGYFSKVPDPYVVLDGTTLTFYND